MRPALTQIEMPEPTLVVLCGASGSGKSTFAGRHFAPTEIVSSDQCRALIGDDETDQAVTGAAFDLLHTIVRKRLETGIGRLTVVDATNTKPPDRKELAEMARRADIAAAAIVFDLPLALCIERAGARQDRQTPRHAVKRQHETLRRTARRLRSEGFARVYTIGSTDELDSVTVSRTKLWCDRRDDSGPFDIIGDVHGCHAELMELLDRLGYDIGAAPISHPEGRRAVFVGDLVDRGPGVADVLDVAMSMVDGQSALAIAGNHEHKLHKALTGRRVQLTHGLAESMAQLEARDAEFRDAAAGFLRKLISHYVLDDGRLVVAHAGLPERYHGRASGRVRDIALYGETDGESDEFGLPVRYRWADDYRGAAAVVYGHTPVPAAQWVNNTICLDTGVVFGGELTALRWPERELVSVPAAKVYYEPVRPLASEAPPTTKHTSPAGRAAAEPVTASSADGPRQASEEPTATKHTSPAGRAAGVSETARPRGVLDISDVLGKHVIDTSLMGRITIEAEQSAAAVEVMSRFAVDPRWLAYLPPTMAPVAVSKRDECLEHPDEAFGYYRRVGVREVVCQEKHMGSRAVLIVARNADAARSRFGTSNDAAGVIVTRTGRAFFPEPALAAEMLERLRAAITSAGWWDRLATDWLILDSELLPWSAKGADLIRDLYAATGAAGTTALTAAGRLLAAASERAAAPSGAQPDADPPTATTPDATQPRADLPEASPQAASTSDASMSHSGSPEAAALAEIAARTKQRSAHVESFIEAYRQHCWHTDGIKGIEIAPFQLLAADGEVLARRPHRWHLDRIDELVDQAPDLLRRTDRRWVDVDDADSVAEATRWWWSLTDGGGEGMVAKPVDPITVNENRLVLPGVKCRGREYLRLIYGPEYLAPENLARLRQRSLRRKSSLARREFALGIEALDRFVANEHLARVHQCVFALLALESEPIDPRL